MGKVRLEGFLEGGCGPGEAGGGQLEAGCPMCLVRGTYSAFSNLVLNWKWWQN